MSLSRAFAVVFTLLVCPSLASVAFAADAASMGPPGPGGAFPPAACAGACALPRAPAILYPALSPVAPIPVAPATMAVDQWDTYGFGDCRYPGDYFGACGGFGRCGWFNGPGACGGPAPCGVCGRPPVAYRPAPSPIYIVDQGPKYSGPGFMIPFKTYSPTTDLAAPREFPYISARGSRYVLPRPSSRPPLGVCG
jgi:hypothetical protein